MVIHITEQPTASCDKTIQLTLNLEILIKKLQGFHPEIKIFNFVNK
jgi:hypothetical protein